MSTRLVNVTRGQTIAASIELAITPRQRMKGLLGRKGLDAGSGLVIDPCTSIHMFFMKFPIDVLFVDSGGTVVRAIEHLKPWRLTRFYPSARWCAELPIGALAQSGTREGDAVKLETISPDGASAR
ncbi:MAG: DUF192 domain-containing protein [Deltaproteobacteria bacterium]|nr:DUF192 domain-containing protein [Deltaproteobacteria bacterium]